MAKYLVIVESPNKCKSINKYLGGDYKVLASFGHIRSIPSKQGMVDTKTFEAKYQLTDSGKRQIKEIAKYAKGCEAIYLAMDPDREGEGIAWHIKEVLQSKGIKKPFYRVVFHAITKSDVLEAFNHVRDLDMNLVHAQQSRQNLDYLVGYSLSPLLWKAVSGASSAGRVQSPALKLVETRDKEIKEFKPDEYWSIHYHSHKDNVKYKAKLISIKGLSGKLIIPSEKDAKDIISKIESKQGMVSSVKSRTTSRKPKPPFTTSTLQQDAVRKLNMSSAQVMSNAQKLFEAGYITYMRTDSVVLSSEALTMTRNYISENYPDNKTDSPRTYSSKQANAQEAHEAIRPTDYSNTPAAITGVNDHERKLYSLIWMRTIASQMADALFDVTTVDIAVGDGIFRASGTVMKKSGFLSVYDEAKDIDDKDDDNQSLPILKEGEITPTDEITKEQHFTQPPPKYNEASIIKTLEELGIGRPSTYASIISTLNKRNYVESEKRRMSVTDIGSMVVNYLDKHFNEYLSYDFTAKLENDLDEIANGRKDYLKVLSDFWNHLSELVDKERQRMAENPSRGFIEMLEENCPECSSQLGIKNSKYGKFIACSGYPQCKYTRYLDKDKPKQELIENSSCPKCHSLLAKRTSKKGNEFIGCSAYPKCDYIEGKVEPVDTGVKCPKCKKHNLFKKQGRFGEFVGCFDGKKCRYIEKKSK